MIGIVDYGIGNLMSVRKAFEHLGRRVAVVRLPEEVNAVEKFVLPGVGHFAATTALGGTGLREALLDAVAQGKPLLGICLGMQWLFEGSEEAPQLPGAGLFRGRCEALPASVKSPHVGWSRIEVCGESRLLRGVGSGAFVYFAHSFAAAPVSGTVAVSHYGVRFAAAVERDNVFGVQFHPEKSAAIGLVTLRNFCEL